jgi:hypothetical protein
VVPFGGLAGPVRPGASLALRGYKWPPPSTAPFLFNRFSFIPHLLSSSILVQLWSPSDRSTGHISFAGVCLRKTRSALSADVSKFCNLVSTRLFPEEDDWSSLKDDGQW